MFACSVPRVETVAAQFFNKGLFPCPCLSKEPYICNFTYISEIASLTYLRHSLPLLFYMSGFSFPHDLPDQETEYAEKKPFSVFNFSAGYFPNPWTNRAQEVGTSKSLGQVRNLLRWTLTLKKFTENTAKVRKELLPNTEIIQKSMPRQMDVSDSHEPLLLVTHILQLYPAIVPPYGLSPQEKQTWANWFINLSQYSYSSIAFWVVGVSLHQKFGLAFFSSLAYIRKTFMLIASVLEWLFTRKIHRYFHGNAGIFSCRHSCSRHRFCKPRTKSWSASQEFYNRITSPRDDQLIDEYRETMT